MSEPYVSRTNAMYRGQSVPGDYKRLILCCDGTWQAADKGFRSVPSNVVKFSRALERASKVTDQHGHEKEIQQIVYYQSGVATGNSGKFARKFYGNLGVGLDQNVVSAYYFLSNNYDPEDEIFMFGFSRGAYTVRIVADLIAKFGIIQKEHIDRFPVLYEEYTKRKSDDEFFAKFGGKLDQYANHKAKVKVLGCWDTVGSMGAPSNWPWWAANIIEYVAGYDKKEFRDAILSNNVEHAFHALALDEHRQPFSPALWHLPPKQPNVDQPNLIQCWFPGVHINIGGGSSDNKTYALSTESATEQWLAKPNSEFSSFIKYNDKTDLENMADITFAWMVDLCLPYLAFDLYYIQKLERAMADMLKHAPKTPLRAYASGPIVDSYSSTTGWLTGGSCYRSPGQYDERNTYNANLVSLDTNEFIHPSVRVRMDTLGSKWVVPALKDFHLEDNGVESEQTTNWAWRKTLADGERVVLREWRTKKREWFTHGMRSAEEMWMGTEVMKDLGVDD